MEKTSRCSVSQPKKASANSVIKQSVISHKSFYDANSGKNYYYNKTTGTTQWKKPIGVVFRR